MEHYVVKRHSQSTLRAIFFALRRGQHEAAVDTKIAIENLFEAVFYFAWRNIGKKAEFAAVNPDHRYLRLGDCLCHVQHAAVAANHDHEV